MAPRSGSFPIAVAVVALLAGSAAAAPPGVGSPCKLTTPREVNAAFGGTAGPGKLETTIPGAPTCQFSVKHSNLGIDGTAIVFITPGQTKATFALARKIVPGAVSIAGIGDNAFYNPRTTTVELIKGTTVANAQAVFLAPGGPGPSAAMVQADVIALAKSVARHLSPRR